MLLVRVFVLGSVLALAACGRAPSNLSQELDGLGAISIETTGETALTSEFLASCRVGGQPVTLRRKDFATVTMNGVPGVVVSATQFYNRQQPTFRILLSSGGFLQVAQVAPSDAHRSVSSSRANGGTCQASATDMNLPGLERLVLDAKPRQTGHLAVCRWGDRSDVVVSIAPGMQTRTVVLSIAVGANTSGGDEVAFVARTWSDKTIGNSTETTIGGEGFVTTSGLGRPSAKVGMMRLIRSDQPGKSQLVFGSGRTTELTGCSWSGIDTMKRWLSE